ncbi:MAG: hypothetical protein N3D82_00545 [Ignisphaera sp.]|nr:hypothetical protein [Ignisphaera sp.]MCX8167505.1 hypothetical protein [Ignisphaera sp.]MDW8084632.1 hypothetical protein [Ignisphaera sp.]
MVIVVLSFTVFLLSINIVWYTGYTIPLIALAKSILKHDFTIPPDLCIYVDTALVNDKCIFAGPIGLPLVLSISILLSQYINIGNELFVGGLTTSLFGILTIIASWKLYMIIMGDSRTALIVSVINAFSGPLWIYSTHLFPQAPLSFAFAFFLYLAFRGIKGALREFEYILGGFVASLAIAFDPSITIAVGIASIIVLLKYLHAFRKSLIKLSTIVKYVGLYILGFLPLITFILLYNHIITSNPLSFPEFFMLKRWGIPNYGFTTLPIVGLYILLFDLRKGLFISYPIYVVALAHINSFIKVFKDKYDRLLYVGSIIAPLLVYSIWYDPGGGLSYGPRFAVPITTLLAAPLLLISRNIQRECGGIGVIPTLITGLSVYSIIKNSVVLTTTPYPSSLKDLDIWQNQFIHSVIPQFYAGTRSSHLYYLIKGLVYTEPVVTILSILIPTTLVMIVITISLVFWPKTMSSSSK